MTRWPVPARLWNNVPQTNKAKLFSKIHRIKTSHPLSSTVVWGWWLGLVLRPQDLGVVELITRICRLDYKAHLKLDLQAKLWRLIIFITYLSISLFVFFTKTFNFKWAVSFSHNRMHVSICSNVHVWGDFLKRVKEKKGKRELLWFLTANISMQGSLAVCSLISSETPSQKNNESWQQ